MAGPPGARRFLPDVLPLAEALKRAGRVREKNDSLESFSRAVRSDFLSEVPNSSLTHRPL